MYNKQKLNFKWWLVEEDPHLNVFSHLHFLETDQSYRIENLKRWARLYSNAEYNSIFGSNMGSEPTMTTPRITMNLTQSAIDTVVSKLTKNSPKVTFLTEEGRWDEQQKAKDLTKFCNGLFNTMDIYRKAIRMVKDACIWGTGTLKFRIQDGNVQCEQVLIPEIIVDECDGYYGSPKTLYQVKYMMRDVIKQLFPGNEELIDAAKSTDVLNYMDNFDREDVVCVAEGWHLGPDGRHVICIGNATLLDEKYEADFFPFIFFRWNDRQVGFYGQGIAEQGAGIQYELNKLLKTIQISMNLVSIPKTFIQYGSKIVKQQFNNIIGDAIYYAGQEPNCRPLGVIPPELFTHADRLVQRYYELIGVSAMSAQSKKPQGWDASAKALREFNDIESERFLEVGKRYEYLFMDAAKLIIKMVKSAKLDDLSIKWKGGSFIERISWKDVDMEEDQYVMGMFPTSALSGTPQARLADIENMIRIGFIEKAEAMRLMDFPDLKSVTDLYTAAEEDINRTVALMMKNGEYLPPEPIQDLERGISMVNSQLLVMRGQGAPEERLELLRRWVVEAAAILSETSQPPLSSLPPEMQVPENAEAAVSTPVTGGEVMPPPQEAMPLPEAEMPME